MNNKHSFFGEVLKSNLSIASIQCWQPNVVPSFGSLVMIEDADRQFVGVVCDIMSGSSDPVRQPFAYQKTEAELKRDHPQIFMFIQTTVTVALLGFIDAQNNIWHMVPPQPARLHSFVQPATDELFCSFFKTPRFLHMLFTVHRGLLLRDDLLLSIMQKLACATILTPDFLYEASQQLSLLAGADYKQLKVFLQRLEQLIPAL